MQQSVLGLTFNFHWPSIFWMVLPTEGKTSLILKQRFLSIKTDVIFFSKYFHEMSTQDAQHEGKETNFGK